MSVFTWTAPIFKFAGRRWSEDDFRELAGHLRPFVPPGGVFADLGGGTGDLGSGIAQVLDARVIIIDRTPQMLRKVDAHPLVSQSLASAERLPFPDGSFDALVCSDAFHHMHDQEAAAREIGRVVKPGGAVLMLELAPGRTLMWLERLLGEPANFRTMDDLAGLLAGHGIEAECTPMGASYLCLGVVQGPSSTAI